MLSDPASRPRRPRRTTPHPRAAEMKAFGLQMRDYYRSIGHTTRKKGTGNPHYRDRYYAYLLSDTWKQIRERLFFERGRACERCGGSGRLQIHHRHYRNVFHERDEDLVILCFACHEREHHDQILKKKADRAKPLEKLVRCAKCGAGPKRLRWASSFDGHCFDCGAHFKIEVTARKPRAKRR